MQFFSRLMHQIIIGLLDEWALPFMQNALCVAEATINIATVPFCSLIPIQN